MHRLHHFLCSICSPFCFHYYQNQILLWYSQHHSLYWLDPFFFDPKTTLFLSFNNYVMSSLFYFSYLSEFKQSISLAVQTTITQPSYPLSIMFISVGILLYPPPMFLHQFTMMSSLLWIQQNPLPPMCLHCNPMKRIIVRIACTSFPWVFNTYNSPQYTIILSLPSPLNSYLFPFNAIQKNA